jgi:hypothetical protein
VVDAEMIRRCSKCGFILGTKPGLYEKNGVCGACINAEKAKGFDWQSRYNELTKICEGLRRQKAQYDCVIAVSGGKDSMAIVKSLVGRFGLKPLLVTVTDEFTRTQAGAYNIKNIAERFNCNHLIWRCEPETFKRETLKDFENELHPLKWIEEKIYTVPVMIARNFGIKAVFFGENSAFQYGSVDTLDYLHPLSDGKVNVYFFFAFCPYSELDNYRIAKGSGFKDLDDFNEWQRQGNVENYTQIDSIGYIIQMWTKFVKFGYQRVSDVSCRYVRHGELAKEQALAYIRERDHVCDPAAKKDFCRTIGITEKYFDEVVARHANRKLVYQDINGIWRLKE